MPRNPTSVRFRSIAAILLKGIRRWAALEGDSDELFTEDEPVWTISESLYPSRLVSFSQKPLNVSPVSQALGLGDGQDIQNGGNL